MTARAGRRDQRRPAVPEFHPGQVLDWTHPSHWSWTRRPCRYCGRPTHLRDSQGSPADKTCAESALAEQYTQAQADYRDGEL